MGHPQPDTPIINTYDIVAQLKLVVAALIEDGEIDLDLDAILGQLDVKLSDLQDAIAGAVGTTATLYEVDKDVQAVGTAVGNMATAMHNDIGLLRWGYAVEPNWYGGITAAPGAGATVATRTVAGGKTGRVFGIQIFTPFADVFTVNIGAAAEMSIPLPANGQAFIVSPKELFNGTAASVITIKTTAGGAGNLVAKFLEMET